MMQFSRIGFLKNPIFQGKKDCVDGKKFGLILYPAFVTHCLLNSAICSGESCTVITIILFYFSNVESLTVTCKETDEALLICFFSEAKCAAEARVFCFYKAAVVNHAVFVKLVNHHALF